MDALIRFIHIIAVGCWLGCYLTEAVFEYLGIRDERHLRTAASLHNWVDRYVEIPLFATVLATGAWLVAQAPLTALLSVKIGFALFTIGINVVCAVAVRRRHLALAAGDTAEVERLSVFIRWTFLGLAPGLVPLYIGTTIFMSHFR